MNFPENLTTEEQAEFTPLNFIAHNVLREQSSAKQPCWLCMSNEAKQEARQKAVDWFNQNKNPIIPFSLNDPNTIKVLNRDVQAAVGHLIPQWIKAEAEFKRLRVEENNPLAFFCPN